MLQALRAQDGSFSQGPPPAGVGPVDTHWPAVSVVPRCGEGWAGPFARAQEDMLFLRALPMGIQALGGGCRRVAPASWCCRHPPAPMHSVGQSSGPGSGSQGRGVFRQGQRGSQPTLSLSQPVPRARTSTFSGQAEVRDSGTGRQEEPARSVPPALGFSSRAWGPRVPGPGSRGGPGTLMLTQPLSLSLLDWLLPIYPCPHSHASPPTKPCHWGRLRTLNLATGWGGAKSHGGDGAKGMAFMPLPQRVTPTVTVSMASSWTLALPTRPCSSISGRQTRRMTRASWASIAPVMCAVSARHPLAWAHTP